MSASTTKPKPKAAPPRKPTPPNPIFQKRLPFVLAALVVIAILVGLLVLGRSHVPGWVDVQILAEDSGGRPGTRLGIVNDIAIHYVGNPGTTAQQNHDFFDQPETQVSAHFLVGLEGEVIQCLPLHEVSYATNDRNGDTISIEVCHPDAGGQFTRETYDALVKLTAWLCDHCGIGRDRVIRHYDVTGKLCPLYFVEHPEAWDQFRADVAAY